MKPAYLALGLIAVVGAVCLRLSIKSSARNDVAAISALRSDLDRAVVARDAERVVRLFTTDLVYLESDAKEIVGSQALTNFLRQAYREPGPTPKGRRIASEVRIAGDWAFEWGHVEATRTASSVADTWIDGKYLHVYQRQPDGIWRIARASYSANPPQTTRLAAN